MLFRRRNRPTRIERMRVAVWPRHSWVRSTRYYGKRVLRLSATPHAIAMGFAAGAFASFTPLIGFHFLTAFAIAFIVRGNMIASAFGTAVGNPLTFPFIWAATFKVGQWILRAEPMHGDTDRVGAHLHHGLFEQSFDAIWPTVKPMFVGALPLGLAAGLICYWIVYKSVEVYQHRRRVRFERHRQAFPAQDATLNKDAGV